MMTLICERTRYPWMSGWVDIISNVNGFYNPIDQSKLPAADLREHSDIR